MMQTPSVNSDLSLQSLTSDTLMSLSKEAAPNVKSTEPTAHSSLSACNRCLAEEMEGSPGPFIK